MFEGLIFTSPNAAYLLLMVPLFIFLYVLLFLYRQKTLDNMASRELLEKIMHPRKPLQFWNKMLYVTAAWILAAFAIMDPKGNPHYPESHEEKAPQSKENQPPKRRPHEVVFVVDTSASMSVADSRSGKSRLEASKEVIDEIIRRLNGETISLYALTSVGEKEVPSTMDYVFTRLTLRGLGINETGVPGTDIEKGLMSVMQDYPMHPDEKLKTVIFFSDGGDIIYGDASPEGKEARINAILNALGSPERRNMKFFTVGVGSEKGGSIPSITYQGKPVNSSLDEKLLKIIGEKGNGQYFKGSDYSTMELAETLIKKMASDRPYLEPFEVQTKAYVDRHNEEFIYDLHYQWPLGLAMLFLAVMLIVPDNWRKAEKI